MGVKSSFSLKGVTLPVHRFLFYVGVGIHISSKLTQILFSFIMREILSLLYTYK